MSAWWLIQIAVNIALGLGIAVMWFRLRRPPQDDPRLSRGLQLLQSKIVVLEDLSDRTDAQVKQLNQLIDQKARLLQNKIIEAEHQMQLVEQSMRRSKEVAEIFQDKIPHEEIIERQNTIKYVRAAQMAHSGHSLDEIAKEVDLPIGQIELIAKLNKEQLVFDKDALPEWAKVETPARIEVVPSGEISNLFETPKEEYASLKRLGEEFRNACHQFEFEQEKANEPLIPQPILDGAKRMTSKVMTSASELINTVEAKAKDLIENRGNPASATSPEVRKVEFPKIDINSTLR